MLKMIVLAVVLIVSSSCWEYQRQEIIGDVIGETHNLKQ